MFIDAFQVSEGKWQVNCSHCCEDIGIHDVEYINYVKREREVPLCFECEGHNTDMVPKFFNRATMGDFFFWDDIKAFGLGVRYHWGHTIEAELVDVINRSVVPIPEGQLEVVACPIVHISTEEGEDGRNGTE